jgi:predicted nucleotidyltransferase
MVDMEVAVDAVAKPGLIPPQTIDRAARMLLDAAPPGSQVILFGSYARGDAGAESDLDFMVIEPFVAGQRSEMVRLRQVLRPLKVPVDVLVVSREGFEAWKDKINNVVHEAAREGRVYAAA